MASKYTYDDFQRALTDSGLDKEFSDADLKLALDNPDAGMSILKYKQDYHKAPHQRRRLWPTSERRGYARATADIREARTAASSISTPLLRRISRARRRRHMKTPTRTG